MKAASVTNKITRPPIGEMLADAQWLAHRYNEREDKIHFRWTPREEQRSATFLTDEHLSKDAAQFAVKSASVPQSDIPSAPLHFIFHSAFCCSTMLARVFDLEGRSMGLKEPVILNDLHGWRRREATPTSLGEMLDLSLSLLGRPYAEGEAIVVKPSCLINLFAPAIMAMRPNARAIVLRAPLRIFVGSVARKGMWGRLWVRDWLSKLIPEGLIRLGFEPEDYLRLTDLQAAAVCWLSQQMLFDELATRVDFGRVSGLESEALLARPEESIRAACQLFQIEHDDESVADVVAGPAFGRHSKYPRAYDATERVAEREAGEGPHRDEIDKVTAWAEAVAGNAGLSLDLPRPLLD